MIDGVRIRIQDYRPEIQGWSEDILPLYRRIARELPRGARIVEVGVAHGRSLVFLAEELIGAGRFDAELWGVDSWGGGWWVQSIVQTMARPELARFIEHLRIARCEEVRASRLFDDGSLDVVFVDSDHSEEGVDTSIATWLPKVRPGGLLCGHDHDVSGWPGTVAAVKKWEEKLVGPVGRPTRTCWEWRIQT
jgi:predicted O-methyltransferase YrrM